MKQAILFKLQPFLLLLTVVCLLLACMPVESPSQLNRIYQQQQLRVGLLHSPTSYYIGVDGPAGFEYELSKRLAEQLDVELVIDPSFDLQELMHKLQQGQVDYIAGGLTLTEGRLATFRAAPAYQWINEQLVFHQGHSWPRSLNDVTQPIAVIAGSSHAETMQQLQQDYPHLEWQEFTDRDGDELLQMVVEDRIAFTLTDSNQLAINRRFLPNLSIAFTVQEDRPIGWLLPKNHDDSLYSVLIEFFGELYQSGDLVTLEDRYFGHIRQFDYVDTLKFIEAIEQILPDYQPLFQQYSGAQDWRLLAALSYQESHWNPKARSVTGVRGMMMLTLPTARQMNVDNRLDAEESIAGGSRYLQHLLGRIPERIQLPDRLWFALAAYNIGLGHVEDARVLTQRAGADPDKWHEVKTHLPKLRQKRYYQHTRFGYARGDEAAHYVENIRRYYDTLQWVTDRQQIERRQRQSAEDTTEPSDQAEVNEKESAGEGNL